MKTIALKLYDYIELDDEAKIIVAEEWYYNDGGDFVGFEVDNLKGVYTNSIYCDTELVIDEDMLNFYDTGYITQVRLCESYLDCENATFLDKYVNEHATDKKLQFLLDYYDAYYYYDNDTKKLEVYSLSQIDNRYLPRIEKYLEKALPQILKPISDRLSNLLDQFNGELRLLLTNIRGYLGDSTINDELNDNGWYFTKDGEFVSYDEVDNIIDKLELVEKAYNVEFDVEEK